MAEIQRWGESFKVADKIGTLALMRFAQVARNGVDSDTMEGLAAMGDLLDQAIDPSDLGRFSSAANKNRADGEELMSVVQEVFGLIGSRPTSQPSDSSDGLPTTSAPSAAGYSSPVTRLESKGRPDLALLVSQGQASRVSA